MIFGRIPTRKLLSIVIGIYGRFKEKRLHWILEKCFECFWQESPGEFQKKSWGIPWRNSWRIPSRKSRRISKTILRESIKTFERYSWMKYTWNYSWNAWRKETAAVISTRTFEDDLAVFGAQSQQDLLRNRRYSLKEFLVEKSHKKTLGKILDKLLGETQEEFLEKFQNKSFEKFSYNSRRWFSTK